MESEALYLWIPTSSPTYKDFEYIRDTFGGQTRSEIFVLDKPEFENEIGTIFDHETIVAMIDFHEEVTSNYKTTSGVGFGEVSERSERAFWKTSILAMKCAKWLQT